MPMKFKTIFILFNAVITLSFLFIFLMPVIMLGPEYSAAFWLKNWSLALVFGAILTTLNVFFAHNWRIFTLVEKEDWEKLASWLTEQIYTKKRYRKLHVRFLVSVSLNRSDLASIDRLEAELRTHKPELLRRLAVLFGAVYLLRNDPTASGRFFETYLQATDVDNVGWLWFDYAFTLVLQKREEEAAPWFRKAAKKEDAVLVLLSSYFLGTLVARAVQNQAEKDEIVSYSEKGKSILKKRFDREKLGRELEKARNEVHIVILSKLLDDANRWLFDENHSKTE
jgi:hypothetical protein